MKKIYKHKWPHLTARTKKAVKDQLDKGVISIYNRADIFEVFEDKFAKMHSSKYAVLMSSGTAGLHASMVACNFQPGDEVICPAYTFYATVTPIFQTGATPILCDAGPDGNIDPDQIEKLITKKTKAVMVTHMWGIPCDMDRIVTICKKYNLKLIEDCSHAHGAKYKGKLVGTFGDAAVFSLQGQKIITGGEGGVLITNDKEIFERTLLFGHYNKRCKQEIAPKSKYYDYAVTGFGLKLRAHPLAIAMADEQLDQLAKWHRIKEKNAKYLSKKLKNLNGISLPSVPKGIEPSWYAYVIQLDPNRFSTSTTDFCDQLIERGILDADVPGSTCPLNLLKLFQEPGLLYPSYGGKVAYKPGDFPVAEKFYENAIKFPIDIHESESYKKVLDKYAEIISATLDKYLVKT